MKPAEIEAKVLEVEGIRIVIRAKSDTELGDYTYSNQAIGSHTVAEWGEKRLKSILGEHEYVVLDGHFKSNFHANMTMDSLRHTYSR